MFDVWYWAVLERNKDGRYFAHVPDLPGATAAGDSEQEVLQNIAEIAADHIRDLVEDGHEVPKARGNAEIPQDPEVSEVGRAAIPVDVPGKSVKISLSIDEALLKRIDRAANRAGMTRSGYFAAAAEARIAATDRISATDRMSAMERGLAAFLRPAIPKAGKVPDALYSRGPQGSHETHVVTGKDIVRLGREIVALEQGGFVIPGITDDDTEVREGDK